MANTQLLRLSSLLAAAAAAIALPGVAVAQQTPAPADTPEIAASPADKDEIVVYAVGSIKDRDGPNAVENPRDSKLPAVPVIYENEPAAPAPVTPPAELPTAA